MWCVTLNWFKTTIQQISCHNVLKDTLIWTLIYYLNTIIKSYRIKLKQYKILTMMNMSKMKITTMYIVMILMMIIINNYSLIFIYFLKKVSRDYSNSMQDTNKFILISFITTTCIISAILGEWKRHFKIGIKYPFTAKYNTMISPVPCVY